MSFRVSAMEGNLEDNTALHARIQQLERERDDLHKDIEQLCMQQAGPAYLGVATRMHLHRTAALEQEIENLKKKLAACTRENQNLQEELSEAYHVKSQLADLHSAEVSKNIEAEKQLKFFQGCVASAFAERDNAVMEAEKAKEQEESNSRGFYQLQERVEKISCELLEEKALTATLQSDLEKQSSQLEVFREVVNKFYDIRQHALDDIEDTCLEDKCECLLHDSLEMWSFNVDGETSTSTYIGLEIENHLKKKVRDLEKQKILSEEKIMAEISMLRDFHSQHRINITKLLDEGFSELKSDLRMVDEKFRQLDMSSRGNDLISPQVDDVKESECRDVHINTESSAELSTEVTAFLQFLQHLNSCHRLLLICLFAISLVYILCRFACVLLRVLNFVVSARGMTLICQLPLLWELVTPLKHLLWHYKRRCHTLESPLNIFVL
nr:liprin-alpha-2-like isoform X1 [Ipomoea batatas]